MPAIKSYRSPKTEIRKSEKGGMGLFAKQDIRKGEVVFIKSGHILKWEQVSKLIGKVGDCYMQIDDDFFLCPTTEDEVRDIAIYVNHSCDPNIGPDGQVTFVALRGIKSGEELCYDYAMDTDHPFEVKCRCGSGKCRKIITGNDWKLKGLQDRYGNHFSWFILKRIKPDL
jgi:SET domain-containing protein